MPGGPNNAGFQIFGSAGIGNFGHVARKKVTSTDEVQSGRNLGGSQGVKINMLGVYLHGDTRCCAFCEKLKTGNFVDRKAYGWADMIRYGSI